MTPFSRSVEPPRNPGPFTRALIDDLDRASNAAEMATIETLRSRPPNAQQAPGRLITADPVALLRARLAFPREVFDVLVEPMIRGLAGCMPSARQRDAASGGLVADPLGPRCG